MKKTIKTAFTLLLTAALMTGFSGCKKSTPESTANESIVSLVSSAKVADEAAAENKSGVPAGIFREIELLKIGEHTYYPADLFESNDRNKHYKDHMISQLQQADKELHDDIYVHGIGETEVKGEFRFFGNMMKDGVIWDTAEMTCWYDEQKGSEWSINPKFRRSDFDKNGLIKAEDLFGAVYEKASRPEALKKMNKAQVTEGAYLLFSDGGGRLFYRFAINKNSIVEVDAKTGEVIGERYWNGRYT